MPIKKTDLINKNDDELFVMARGESEDADVVIEYLLEKYKGLVTSKARPLYLVGGDRDDLLQEGMIGLYKAIREFDNTRSEAFVPYAGQIIYQHMCNAIVAYNRKKNSPLNEYVSLYTPIGTNGEDEPSNLIDTVPALPENSDPEYLVIDKENTDMLEFELGKCLSALEKKVYELYVGGMDYKMIATELGKSPKAIDNALQRIRGKMKKLLERHES